MDLRREGLKEWIDVKRSANEINLSPDWVLTTVSGDASFRRYFRAADSVNHFIAVDAPTDKENSEPFVRIANAWRQQGVHVPEVIHADLTQGYMLLEDLGDQQLLPLLTSDSVDHWYAKAIGALEAIQTAHVEGLPKYDDALLLREMRLLDEWFAPAILGSAFSKEDREVLDPLYDLLISSALAQPVVCVHRDYHSRNLMCLDGDELGIIDFQDAVMGPITYDLVSILKDCYIQWPRAKVVSWVEQNRLDLQALGGLSQNVTQEAFLRWFDLMGLQRHIKVLGIFCRLALRDQKYGYLADLPRVYQYVLDISMEYSELADFSAWLDQKITPSFQSGIERIAQEGKSTT